MTIEGSHEVKAEGRVELVCEFQVIGTVRYKHAELASIVANREYLSLKLYRLLHVQICGGNDVGLPRECSRGPHRKATCGHEAGRALDRSPGKLGIE